jgi:hypothetical protein
VIESCVGCGLCGEVAHAAVLCPSFYRAEVIKNPNGWDRWLFKVRSYLISSLGGYATATGSPHPLRGRDREGGEPQTPTAIATPTPGPSPQGGGELRVIARGSHRMKVFDRGKSLPLPNGLALFGKGTGAFQLVLAGIEHIH